MWWSQSFDKCFKDCSGAKSRATSLAKASPENKVIIAALKRCATQTVSGRE
jgi:hypothetical protein